MGRSKEYYLRLQEEEYENLPFEEKCYLNNLGIEVRQKETDIDKDDPHYQQLKKARLKSWNEEQEYLFKKRNNMFGNGSANFD